MTIKKFDSFINEYNLSTENYSKYYYLVLRLNENTLNNLYTGRLDGLNGISNSTNIINAFFDVRDILLVMDKKDVEELNFIEKINYDDIDALSKNNFKLLKRLYDVKDDYTIQSLLYQGFMKIKHGKDYKKLRSIVFDKLSDLRYGLERNIHKLGDDFSNNTYDEFIDKAYNKLKNALDFPFSKDDMEKVFRLNILNFSELFKHEEEIMVNSSTFIIPPKSVIFIKEQNKYSYKFEEVNNLLSRHLDKLKEKYYVKILPYKQSHSAISDTHKQAFIYLRYLDKIRNK